MDKIILNTNIVKYTEIVPLTWHLDNQAKFNPRKTLSKMYWKVLSIFKKQKRFFMYSFYCGVPARGVDSRGGRGGPDPPKNMHWGVQRVKDPPIKKEHVCYLSRILTK